MTILFFNLTNHPISGWSKKQIEAAKKIENGNVTVKMIDMPFPKIDPEWDQKKVNSLAADYCQSIIHCKSNSCSSVPRGVPVMFDNEGNRNETDWSTDVPSMTYIYVHLMGEASFCYALKKQLEFYREATIVISTTKREVVEENGVKKSKFEFVRFRKIPPF